ncbi:MAG TPA: DNA repair protein RecO [Bacteroidota bacterium]|nr:DNA repair protein RecO [Bacteroidota bacterium]
MSAISKTDAVILRTMKFRESSKIVSFYTRQFGKMSAIVKGAQRAKHGFGTMLEPMSHVALVVYRKDGRDIQTISQCDSIESFRHIREDLEKMAAGMSIIELVSLIAHEEENGPLFKLLTETLRAIDVASSDPKKCYWYFHLKMMGVLGFEPKFDRCAVCAKELAVGSREIKFLLGKGGPLCPACQTTTGTTVAVSAPVHRFLHHLNASPELPAILPVPAVPGAGEEVEGFLWAYLRFHIAGIGTLRAGRVFSQVLSQI